MNRAFSVGFVIVVIGLILSSTLFLCGTRIRCQTHNKSDRFRLSSHLFWVGVLQWSKIESSCVGPETGCFASIYQAIKNASSDETISVQGGRTYREIPTVVNSSLTLAYIPVCYVSAPSPNTLMSRAHISPQRIGMRTERSTGQ